MAGKKRKTAKHTLHLSAEASERLHAHALKTGESLSGIVDVLIRRNLRRWIIVDRGELEDESKAERRAG